MSKYKLVSLDGDELEISLSKMDVDYDDVLICKMPLSKYTTQQMDMAREVLMSVFDTEKVLIMDENCELYTARRV